MAGAAVSIASNVKEVGQEIGRVGRLGRAVGGVVFGAGYQHACVGAVGQVGAVPKGSSGKMNTNIVDACGYRTHSIFSPGEGAFQGACGSFVQCNRTQCHLGREAAYGRKGDLGRNRRGTAGGGQRLLTPQRSHKEFPGGGDIRNVVRVGYGQIGVHEIVDVAARRNSDPAVAVVDKYEVKEVACADFDEIGRLILVCAIGLEGHILLGTVERTVFVEDGHAQPLGGIDCQFEILGRRGTRLGRTAERSAFSADDKLYTALFSG